MIPRETWCGTPQMKHGRTSRLELLSVTMSDLHSTSPLRKPAPDPAFDARLDAL